MYTIYTSKRPSLLTCTVLNKNTCTTMHHFINMYLIKSKFNFAIRENL